MTEVLNDSFTVAQAYLDSLESGVVELESDWTSEASPLVALEGRSRRRLRLTPIEHYEYGLTSHYFVDEAGVLVFLLNPETYPSIDYEETRIFLAGEFNGWEKAVRKREWRLKWEIFHGIRCLVFRDEERRIPLDQELQFKFVTEHDHWLLVDMDAPNARSDETGRWNYFIQRGVTGRHRFRFELKKAIDLSENNRIVYQSGGDEKSICLHPGDFFFSLSSDKELGSIVRDEKTIFRLFAPRAKWVKVGIFQDLADTDSIEWILMEKSDDLVWEATIGRNLSGSYYWFRLDGPEGPFGLFDPDFKILDPYAKATVSAVGPGIVIDDSGYECGDSLSYAAPQWQDLVIVECHVQDLTSKKAEYKKEAGKVCGFGDLAHFARSDSFYPCRLGANAVELQPIQENDATTADEYHWGYMTTNFFAPNSKYGSAPESASQVEELREAVKAMHDRGLAVIADVVYNHVGEPAHLMYIDKQYYFHLGGDGSPTNWSGCGNDLRCDTPMARRIIIESLKRLALFYGIDGFRFDLADLVGKATLVEVEKELKAVRPDIILIAEPWSFRGHIGMELRDTGYASWNDGYREFLKKYVKGKGNQDGVEYFLRGSPDHYATWPAQTVNYVESHDDRVWIDDITRNSRQNGQRPTLKDARRTRLMTSLLMMSIGIPMLHAGQDFMMSKGGFRNSYQRGDLNALDYDRELDYPGMTEYARRWVQFRRSKLGGLTRHFERVGDGFFRFFKPKGTSAVAYALNLDRTMGDEILLYGVNPTSGSVSIELGEWGAAFRWKQICDHDRFWGLESEHEPVNRPGAFLNLPRLSCGLWVAKHF